jgi:hypothetical protein
MRGVHVGSVGGNSILQWTAQQDSVEVANR